MAIDEVIGALGGIGGGNAGVVAGALVAVHEDGTGHVTRGSGAVGEPLVARSIVALRREDAGREVLLAFLEGDPARPVILGVMQDGPPREPVHVQADGGRLVIRGEQEIVLQCGKASLTLTRAGKVLIRGAYVLSRSSGVNRIKGGSVQIN